MTQPDKPQDWQHPSHASVGNWIVAWTCQSSGQRIVCEAELEEFGRWMSYDHGIIEPDYFAPFPRHPDETPKETPDAR